MKLPTGFLHLLPDSQVSVTSWEGETLMLEVIKDATIETWQVSFSGVEYVFMPPYFESDRWEVQSPDKIDLCNGLSLSENMWAFILHNAYNSPSFIIAKKAEFRQAL